MTSRLALVTVLLFTVGGAIGAQVPAAPPTQEASLAALVTEVHQLRLAVEEAARSQAQSQATSVYLSAEQARIVQITNSLNGVRGELGKAVATHDAVAAQLSEAQAELARSTNAEERGQATYMIKVFTQQADQAGGQQAQLQNREAQLTAALQVEEQRWSDLVARLEQIIRK